VIFWRVLQAIAALGLLSTLHLVWQASPMGPQGAWQAGRLLYAGAGAIGALTLLAVALVGARLVVITRRLAAIEAALERQGPPAG
jgi:threonine dehydrogenase-like Zn-dependent dehydrogenase